MKPIPLSALIGAVIGVPIALFFLAGKKGVRFDDIKLNEPGKQLDILSQRNCLDVNTTSQDGILGNIGLVLVVDHVNSTTAPQSLHRLEALGEFRPSREELMIQPIGTLLYEGKVSRDLAGGGSFLAFASSLTQKQASDVAVTDDIFFGYKDSRSIPYSRLKRLKLDRNKSYFFIESATLTTVTHKVYEEADLGSKLSGTAFSANGKVYVSNSGYIYYAMLAVDVLDVALLQSGEGGSDPNIAALLRKPELTPQEGGQLAKLLKSASLSEARARLGDKTITLHP